MVQELNILKKSSLILFMKKLKQSEVSLFEDFLKSPYHNKNKTLVVFFKEIVAYYPDFEDPKFTPEKIYKKVYGAQVYKEKTMTNSMSLLKKALESFMVHEEINLDEALKLGLSRKAYIRRDYKVGAIKTAEVLSKKLMEEEYKSGNDYLQMMCIHDERYKYLMARLTKKEKRNSLVSSMKYLDKFYLITKMDFTIRLLNWKSVYGDEFDIPLLKEALELEETVFEEKNILFELYSLIVKLFQNRSDNIFDELYETFRANHKEIDVMTQTLVIGMIMNYAYKQVEAGNLEYRKKLFNVSKFRVNSGLIMEGNQIKTSSYINAIVIAAACEDFEWAIQFQDSYESYLRSAHKRDIVNFTQAFIHFYKREYDATIDRLTEIRIRDLSFELRFRSLLIMTHSELQKKNKTNTEFVLNTVSAFKIFLGNTKRRGILDRTKVEAYNNFCTICQMLINGKSKCQVQGKISGMKYLMNKIWLMEKTNDLRA